MSWFSDLFGLGNNTIRQALREGAVIIDLRTAYEFDQGHIPRSLNLPVDRIKANLERIRGLRRPIILCCATGDHCWEAAAFLRESGISRVYNGGSWQSVLRIINK